MRVAIIGTRHVPYNITSIILPYIPENATEIVSGGAEGVDKAAEQIAQSLSLRCRIFEPNYNRYGKQAPLMRNLEIVRYSDEVLAFWDGSSKGTMQSIAECIRSGKSVRIIPIQPN